MTRAQIAADARKPYADEIQRLNAQLAAAITTISALTVERNNSERREYQAQGTINLMRSSLVELDANCENRQDEPFIGYVRRTCRAALT